MTFLAPQPATVAIATALFGAILLPAIALADGPQITYVPNSLVQSTIISGPWTLHESASSFAHDASGIVPALANPPQSSPPYVNAGVPYAGARCRWEVRRRSSMWRSSWARPIWRTSCLGAPPGCGAFGSRNQPTVTALSHRSGPPKGGLGHTPDLAPLARRGLFTPTVTPLQEPV